ncbi:MAG TPA: peptide-methionine (R)-S-oxide reductase [Aurantimonas coralicida]|uniref:peptide-methionine (R)-S-oxide reductase n=2 Tax=root TaxID=1 RepID=A0A9C9TIQ2_9HYPH|nr:peptide-methionine (R)-S-oxide reductase [Aurantimonas coralicida]HEU02103.1 peptide-methionine (R)-S-oxide reductase [Aurantimonas coralicida]
MMRRNFLLSTAAMAATAIGGGLFFGSRAKSREAAFSVSLTPDEWRAKLTPEQFAVLREESTERPFTSPLNDNKQAGVYACAGCDTPAYSSANKYDSKTGWPSFWAPLSASAIGTRTDYALIYPRTEVHCATCGGHFGHIFDDGPAPTGKRHCLNGVALAFKPGATTAS